MRMGVTREGAEWGGCGESERMWVRLHEKSARARFSLVSVHSFHCRRAHDLHSLRSHQTVNFKVAAMCGRDPYLRSECIGSPHTLVVMSDERLQDGTCM